MEMKQNLTTLLSLIIIHSAIKIYAAKNPPFFLNRGFQAKFDPLAGSFQPLLSDPTGIFTMGFFQTNFSTVDLAVIHTLSSLPVWRAIQAEPIQRSGSASLSFDGRLYLSDLETGVAFWSSPNTTGDRVVLLNSSNLQIIKAAEPVSVLWQSFDFPSDTIVQNQIFLFNASLFSINQRYSMKLGSNFLALFMEFGSGVKESMYWKRTALEATNQIIEGEGPIHAMVSQTGFLGLYQRVNEEVDVLPFDSFGRGIVGLRRLTLESDGNLRGYIWNGTIWASDYVAISKLCDLPAACGSYGLCSSKEPRCSCIISRSDGCFPADSGDLCRSGDKDYMVLRKKGVELANKDLLGYIKTPSYEQCEGLCERNCTCWGAVYSNASGFCYIMNYPVQTMLGVEDETKMGYFKVRNGGNEGNRGRRRIARALMVLGVLAGIITFGVVGYLLWRGWRRRRGQDGRSVVEGMEPGPYRGLNSSSFRSIQMVDSFRK